MCVQILCACKGKSEKRRDKENVVDRDETGENKPPAWVRIPCDCKALQMLDTLKLKDEDVKILSASGLYHLRELAKFELEPMFLEHILR